MSAAVEYKCPNCGGGIQFDSTSQQMKCPYCDTVFEVDAVKEFQDGIADEKDDLHWEEYGSSGESGRWESGEDSGMKQYICQSCGGEIITDAYTAATSCPYCGNPAIIEARLEGMWRPDWVIPFQLDKESAKLALDNHLKGKFFLPKAFKEKSYLDEIKGIYVPFWLFDADAKGSARYRCTRVRTWSDANFTYTKTSYYAVHRAGNAAFRNVPVDGSTKMDDTMMEAIEPFDYSKKVDFQTAYLSGFLADKYDVDAKQSQPRATERIKTSVENMLRETVRGYATCSREQGSVALRDGKTQYALLPVWILNTQYEGKLYPFAMNGQSGKFIGDLPLDRKKLSLTFLGVFAAVSIISTLAVLFA